jgi:hypothetical protein
MKVTLPSGYVAELEEPSVRALLAGGGSTLSIVAAAWADEVASTEDLSDSDLWGVACWAVARVTFDDDAEKLARMCAAFGGLPSSRIGITDPVLAFEFDGAFVPTDAAKQPSAEQDQSGSRIVFTTPGG